MTISVSPIPRIVPFGTPGFTLTTANAAGSSASTVRADASLLAFDTTVPVTQAFGNSAAAGSATVAARRDHVHGMMVNPATDYSCRVFNSANISCANNTVVTLTFDSEEWDTDTMHDASTNTDRITIKTAGLYYVLGMADFASNATGRRRFAIAVNGEGELIAYNEWDTNQVAQTHGNAMCIVRLSVDDYLTFEVYQTSGGALNISRSTDQSPEFMACRIAA